MANPNPQKGERKYKTIGEKGYKSLKNSPKNFDYFDTLKYGRKIVFGQKPTN